MSTGQSLDLSDFGLTRLSQIPQSASFKTSAVLVLTLDGNRLSTLDGLEEYENVVQLSACNNCLVQVGAVQNLPHLVLLNLENNSLMDVSGLQALSKLQWLSLGGNSLKATTLLSYNRLLTHLDLSRNCLSTLPLLTSLPHLSTLLLNGNVISSLAHLERHLPLSLKTLSLAENAIADANQLSFLSELLNLEQLMVSGNPCLKWQGRNINIGPFVLYWCPRLAVLNGSPVGDADRCVAHLLFPQSSQYPFRLGQQAEVAQYLLQIVPHLMHVANQLPNSATSSCGGSTVVIQHKMNAEGSAQTSGQSGHTDSRSPAKDTNHSIIHPGGRVSLSKKSMSNEVSHREESNSGGLLKSTGSSKDASRVGEGKGGIDDSRFKPSTTAEEKLEILKRLNSAIAEHRKKVGVESILHENSHTSTGGALAPPNAEKGQSRRPPVLQSAPVYIPLVPADNKGGRRGDPLIHDLPGDLTQMSVMHSVSPGCTVHPSQLLQQRTLSTPTPSTCSEEDNSDYVEREEEEEEEKEEDVAVMAANAVCIQAWWKGCSTRRWVVSYAKCEKAAVMIQSAWRGFLSRRHDPKVMWACSELKRRKMESYVVVLLHQLKGCQQQVAHNAQVIQLQEETLRTLMLEVRAIQDWQGGEKRHRQNYAATLIQRHWRGFVARRKHPDAPSLLSKHPRSISYSLYQKLKEDVDALKEKVNCLGGEGRSSFVEGAKERYERLGFLHKLSSEEHNSTSVPAVSQSSVASQTDVLGTATAAAYSDAESVVEPIVTEATAPLHPPTNLHMSHYSASCVQLKWDGPDCAGVLGYNVYVNNVVEGRVGPTRRKAYLDGLDAATTYNISIRAIYKEGESEESNPILASVKMQPSVTAKATKRLHFSFPPEEFDPPLSSLVFDQRTQREELQTHPPVSAEEDGILTQTAQTRDTSQQLLLQSTSTDDTVTRNGMCLDATTSSGGLDAAPSVEGIEHDNEALDLGRVQEKDGTWLSDAKLDEATPAKGDDSTSPIHSSNPPQCSGSDDTTGSDTTSSISGQSDGCLTPLEDDGQSTNLKQAAVGDVALTCQLQDTEKPLLTPSSSSGIMTPLNFDLQSHQPADSDADCLALNTKPIGSPLSTSQLGDRGLTSTDSVMTVNLDWGELFDTASPVHVPIPLSTIPLPSVSLPHFSEYSHGCGHVSVVNTTTPSEVTLPQQCDHPSGPGDSDHVLHSGCSKEGEQLQATMPTSMV